MAGYMLKFKSVQQVMGRGIKKKPPLECDNFGYPYEIKVEWDFFLWIILSLKTGCNPIGLGQFSFSSFFVTKKQAHLFIRFLFTGKINHFLWEGRSSASGEVILNSYPAESHNAALARQGHRLVQYKGLGI